MRSPYGKKGGESPTSGRKASMYEATAPDGSRLIKRTFRVQADEATMVAYEHSGRWYIASVQPSEALPEWTRSYTLLPARRVR